MAETTPTLPGVGDVFDQRFRVQEQLTDGGFAKLYKARDITSQRDVALKILVPHSEAAEPYPPEVVAKFEREAKALSVTQSPYSVRLHEYGTSDALLFIVFEFVEGRTLKAVIGDGPMSSHRVIHISRQLLQTLGALHAKGIIHRDIKPTHVMLCDQGGDPDHVKLLDFGVAKSWTHTSEGEPLLGDLTAKGRLVGTPRYMSPEQVVGRRLAPSSDIYSLGLVMFEMLTGKPANVGEDVLAVMRQHLSEASFELPESVDLPPEARQMLRRMLQKRSADRPQNVAEVVEALRTLVAPVAAIGGPVDGDAMANDATVPMSLGMEDGRDSTTQPAVLALVESEEPTLPADSMTAIADEAAQSLADESEAAAPEAPEQVPAAPSEEAFDPAATDRIVMERADEGLTLEFPGRFRLPDVVLLCVIGMGTFASAVMVSPWLAGVGLAGMLAFALAARVSRRLALTPQRWTIETRLGPFKSQKLGGTETIVMGSAGSRLELRSSAGTFRLAAGFTHPEADAVCRLVNGWVTEAREEL